jgi:hypothetical protein
LPDNTGIEEGGKLKIPLDKITSERFKLLPKPSAK